jgi:hypothetical protein
VDSEETNLNRTENPIGITKKCINFRSLILHQKPIEQIVSEAPTKTM